MIELPEAITLGHQINETLAGKTVTDVFNATSPHQFTFFNGDSLKYKSLLTGHKIVSAKGAGIFVDIALDQDVNLSISDGVKLNYGNLSSTVPDKYQLLLTFDDDTFLAFSVAMYGGIWGFRGFLDNSYHTKSTGRISPINPEFDRKYFEQCLDAEKKDLSLKAFLATEQRFPGIGNGVLQDILYRASLHPKRKCSSLSDADKKLLWESIRQTLAEMTAKGGRDTETDLFEVKGGLQNPPVEKQLYLALPEMRGCHSKRKLHGWCHLLLPEMPTF